MTDEGALFDVDQPPPAPRLSPDQRRTQRQRDMIAKGIHPQRALLPGTQTCGTCDHLARSWGRYLKCDLVTNTRSASTDIRAGWPACVLWQEAQR